MPDLNSLRGILLFVMGFTFGVLVLFFHYNWYPILFPVYERRLAHNMNLKRPPNVIHIAGKPLEHVKINNLTDNIYYSVKTSVANYGKRLFVLTVTWFQTLPDRNKLTIVSDSPNDGTSYVNMIRNAGFNLILSDCFNNHSANGLCCKSGIEFESYYKALEDHKPDEGSYQWFCHFDDDVYVNVPQLSHHLSQFDSRKPYYIGKWPGVARANHNFVELTSLRSRRIHKMNHSVKAKMFQYATGSAYCISHALMMEAEQFLNGKRKFCESGRLVLYRDDMSLGVIMGVILGYKLTNIDEFHCQYEDLQGSTLQQMLHYVTVGYKEVNNDNRTTYDHTAPLKSPFARDPTKFLAYHCLLYPRVSWCKNQWSITQ